MFRALFVLFILLVACATAPTPPPTAPTPTAVPVENRQLETNSTFAGWAYEAYPETTSEKMRDAFALMRANGANAVWLGHNNPGQVDPRQVEPGLSYAVYAALQNKNDPLYTDAQAIAGAVKRALDAARATDLRVILPVGYQVQMGDAWNAQYPNDLRRSYDGSLLNHYNSGFTASPYSAQYRADITRYYEWVEKEYVAPYGAVIAMVSLADEPMGGDYSDAAKQEFARRYGKPMEVLTPDELWQIGEFQSGVIADYAAWSAQEWQRIHPQLLTTMSFHGGDTARRVWGLPDIEKLFSQTPDNFVVTFDAYLHDDLATKPATPQEAAELKLFLTTLGHLSREYHKPLALWAGVNAWGLAQESSSPLGAADAVSNLLLLYDLPTHAGGTVFGVFAWNYNVKRQGVENYAGRTTFEPAALQVAVERTFPLLRTRQVVARSPEIAVVVSTRAMYDALASSHASDTPPAWFDAGPYARALANRSAVIVTSPRTLQAARDASFFILATPVHTLDQTTLKFLREQFDAGRTLLTNDPALAQRWNVPGELWRSGLEHLPSGGDKLYLFEE